MSVTEPESSETASKKRQGYFQNLRYTSLFNAQKLPTSGSPSSSIGSKFRRQFNPFKSTAADADEEGGKSTSYAESSPMCNLQENDVATLEVDSTENQRSKRTKGSECLGGLKVILDGKTHPTQLVDADCSADCAQDEQQPDSGSQLGLRDDSGLEDKVTCSAVSCIPSFRLGQRAFGRDVSNHGDGGARPKGERAPDTKTAGENTTLKSVVEVPAEGELNTNTVEGNPIPVAGSQVPPASPSDAHMTSATSGDRPAATELPGSQKSAPRVPSQSTSPVYNVTESKACVGDPLQALADAQAKIVAQLEGRLKRLEEASEAQEQRAAATNERKTQAEEAVRRALGALHRAQEALHSLEEAALRAASRARACHVAADEARQHLQRVVGAQQREREELERALRAQGGGKAAAAERLRELAATLASIDFGSTDAATVRRVEAALSQLALQWAQCRAAGQ